MDENAMKLAIESYQKVLGEELTHRILQNSKRKLTDHFFALRRYIEDHLQETDLEKIEKIVTAPIPLSTPERRFFYEGIPENIVAKTATRCGPYQIGVVSAQGPRETMEDTYISGEISEGIYLFGILDGHGGTHCAKFVKNNLKKYIRTLLDNLNDTTIYNSLSEICILIDEAWKEYVHRKTAEEIDYSGTTALISLIIQDRLWVVNVGDSRAVMGAGQHTIQLSEDAKPPLPHYRDEIEKRGGFVEWNRVDGSLDLARSIGDIGHPSVSARPTIRKFDLTCLDPAQNNILILATDGLWDVIGSEEAVLLCQGKESLKDLALGLVNQAYASGSTDNVTVMLVRLT